MTKRYYDKLTPDERLARAARLLAQVVIRQLKEQKERRPDVGPTRDK